MKAKKKKRKEHIYTYYTLPHTSAGCAAVTAAEATGTVANERKKKN
jgi:hypothetical protein